jgi:cell division initiation protein
MKLTPLDIHHKEFHHALRGYSEEEVDTFLDEVADEFERLFKENIELSEKLEAATAKVRDYQSMEVTLNNTMVSAQRASEQIVAQANDEASVVLRDAQVKAKEIIHSALTDKQRAQGELVRMKSAEEDFRGRFRALLEGYLATIEEVALPQDVNEIIGESASGAMPDGDVDLGEQEAERPAPVAKRKASAEPKAAEPIEEVEEAPADAADADDEAEPDKAEDSAAVAEAMTFGELESPELEDTDFGDVREFETPSLDAFGERDDDIDIEEID